MDEETAHAFVNRDDPIPVVSITSPSNHGTPFVPSPDPSATPDTRKRDTVKKVISGEKLKEKLDDIVEQKSESPNKLQDRLFTMLLQRIVPNDDLDDVGEAKDRRSRAYVNRPNFSLPLMSSNFRRFNARIGVAFVFQNRAIRLFTWRQPSQTLSFLAVYTFVCLDPYLLPVIPLAACLFFIMVPAFLARHPPPPANAIATGEADLQQSLGGPPIAPPKSVKPAPDLSKDFFRNMRDLQNSMEDFSRLHDALVKFLAPPTNFSNESMSTVIFVGLTFVAAALFITSHLLPWRTIFLVLGWVVTVAGHPAVKEMIDSNRESKDKLRQQQKGATSALQSFIAADVVLESAPETREVEVFELQRRDLLETDNATAWGASEASSEFEPFMYCPGPYAPLEPARSAGERPRGTRFFEDVKPPVGWTWADKKWILDLLSRDWVEERCVTGVEVEVEGERWVTDLMYEEENIINGASPKANKLQKTKAKKGTPQTWEEGNGTGKKGEWRRRRWVRLVKRSSVDNSNLT